MERYGLYWFEVDGPAIYFYNNADKEKSQFTMRQFIDKNWKDELGMLYRQFEAYIKDSKELIYIMYRNKLSSPEEARVFRLEEEKRLHTEWVEKKRKEFNYYN
jgi:hypothetical protein